MLPVERVPSRVSGLCLFGRLTHRLLVASYYRDFIGCADRKVPFGMKCFFLMFFFYCGWILFLYIDFNMYSFFV